MTTEPMNSEAASQPSSYAAAEPIPVSIIKDETAEKVRAATYGGWSAFQFAGTEKQAVQVLRFDERRRRAVLLCLPGTSGNSVPVVSSIAIGNPAAGANWSYTVPAGTTLSVSIVKFLFTADAVAGTRIPTVIISDATGAVVYQTFPSTTQGVSSGISYIFAPGDTIGSTGGLANYGTLPDNLTLPAGWTIASATVGFDAGDQYSGITIVGYVGSTNKSTALAAGNLWLGSKAQIANGNPSGSGGMLTSGNSLTVESATDIWCMPDGVHPLTLVVLDELYRT